MNYTSKYDERNANTEELYIHNYTLRNISSKEDTLFRTSSHYWGVIITVIGTVLLDFNADACQSPSRAYLLDITTPVK
ncbi:hypothetical protein NQ315_002517 [Exocentrus adspersus]|uniref:Uncharacterized protein n=1 Tax=Exocentrus adspersus TaxID=1586481 RepID=A0AAV8VL98_9CUCU|nr:hypothetical protein NQ315_002517 [Exocentrus adspersus]